MQYFLMCRSLTYAQRGARMLERAGITASVSRAPGTMASRGCGYCIVVTDKYYDRAVPILRNGGLAPEKIFRRHPDGSTEEVRL